MGPFEAWIKESGYESAWFRGSDIDLAVARVGSLAPSIDRAIYKRYFESFRTSAELGMSPDDLALIVIIPKKVRTVSFELDGMEYEASIPPPIYCDEPSDIDLFDDEVAGRLGGRSRPIRFPMKSTCAMLGISRYGRNNITYIDGLGSLFIMRGYAVTGPVEDGIELREPAFRSFGREVLSPECDGCFACVASCPTGAIPEDRLLLRAERCMTYHNKNAGDFPAWMGQDAHNCLLGCLQCQACCPMDEGKLAFEPSGIAFSEDETLHLLGRPAKGRGEGLAAGIEDKFSRLGIGYMGEHIPRNLRTLFAGGNLKGKALR